MTALIGALVAGLVVALPAAAQPANAPSATGAMIDALERVCRPAAERQLAPDPFATQAGYAPQAAPPPHLPLANAAQRIWRAPSPQGRIYVVAGALPDVATISSCMVALYGAPAPALVATIAQELKRANPNFALNAAAGGASRTLRITRFDRREGDTVHSVFVAESLAPEPDAPTAAVAALTVDFGWRRGAER